MIPFHFEDTSASCSAADDAVFEVGPLVPTNIDVGHTMDLQSDIEALRLFPKPLDGPDGYEAVSHIFGTLHSTATQSLPWFLGDQDIIFGRATMADINDAEWQLRRPPRTSPNGLGNRVRTHLAFLITAIINPHCSSELR